MLNLFQRAIGKGFSQFRSHSKIVLNLFGKASKLRLGMLHAEGSQELSALQLQHYAADHRVENRKLRSAVFQREGYVSVSPVPSIRTVRAADCGKVSVTIDGGVFCRFPSHFDVGTARVGTTMSPLRMQLDGSHMPLSSLCSWRNACIELAYATEA